MDRPWTEVIEDNPIAEGLDSFRASFRLITKSTSISETAGLNQLNPNELQNLVLTLLSALQVLPAARSLRTANGRTIFDELSRLYTAVATDNFELDRVEPLIQAAVNKADDATVWDYVKSAVAEATPPPRAIASSIQQTPWLRNTSSFPNSSEHRKHVDGILKEELGHLYVGIPEFWDKYFGGVDELETASEDFFKQCLSGPSPMFNDGWTTWPTSAKEEDVLEWFSGFSRKLATFAADRRSSPSRPRRPLAKPNMPIDGSVGKRKLDIGFVNDPEAQTDTRCHWSRILVPGELKSNPSADKAAEAWLDLGRYAREMLAAQDTRRFVLGFTICGAFMRVWVFDRLGGIEEHSFMHDLESFFWVLFWICVHYDTNGRDVGPTVFDSWNFEGDDDLAEKKKGVIADEEDFLKKAEKHFTSYYQPMVPWVNRLRREVFPRSQRWKRPEPSLYSSMKRILNDAQKDADILADT